MDARVAILVAFLTILAPRSSLSDLTHVRRARASQFGVDVGPSDQYFPGRPGNSIRGPPPGRGNGRPFNNYDTQFRPPDGRGPPAGGPVGFNGNGPPGLNKHGPPPGHRGPPSFDNSGERSPGWSGNGPPGQNKHGPPPGHRGPPSFNNGAAEGPAGPSWTAGDDSIPPGRGGELPQSHSPDTRGRPGGGNDRTQLHPSETRGPPGGGNDRTQLHPSETRGPPGGSPHSWNGPPAQNKRGPPGQRDPPAFNGNSHGPSWSGDSSEQTWPADKPANKENEGQPQPQIDRERPGDRETTNVKNMERGTSERPSTVPDDSESLNSQAVDHHTTRRPHTNDRNICRVNEFRCLTGQCLPESVRCDDKEDCTDGSDELKCVATSERIDESAKQQPGCVLPAQPVGGDYELGGCEAPCAKRPGNKVPRNSILTYTCRKGYVLNGNTISACIDDKWYMPPACRKTCPPLESTSVDIDCEYQGKVVPCNEPIKPGTTATLKCKGSYKLPVTNDPGYRQINCLPEGLWDRTIFRCLPECGTAISRGNTLIIHGFKAKVGVFPWHVGVYDKNSRGQFVQICGGTLISESLVVSAAHCFYDDGLNKVRDASNFAIAAGKYYRDWNAEEDYVQKSPVEEVRVADRYMGLRGNFAEDIALLKLKNPFQLTALVRPICLDWDNMHEREQLQVGHSGKVVGWGKTEEGEASEGLQEVNLPFVSYRQCLSSVPTDFRGYITSDKFCAGYLNGSSLCEGDSGGGLCFEMQGVWYLRGIVSVSPVREGTCDYTTYVGFTSVGHFRQWLRDAYVNS